MAANRADGTGPRRIKSVVNAVTILNIVKNTGEMTLHEISAEVDLSKPSILTHLNGCV